MIYAAELKYKLMRVISTQMLGNKKRIKVGWDISASFEMSPVHKYRGQIINFAVSSDIHIL